MESRDTQLMSFIQRWLSKMDGWYKIRRDHPEDYGFGDCCLCHQKNVKVKQLICGKHYFCRMCYEFVPRLRKGNLSCANCASGEKIRMNRQSMDRVDAFIAQQTGMDSSKFQDVTMSVRGDNIISFTDCDDNDLSGNNEEWERLLQPDVSVLENNAHRKSIQKEKHEESEISKRKNNSFPIIPESIKVTKKQSVIRLVVPSIDHKYDSKYGRYSGKQPIVNNVTELIRLESSRSNISSDSGSMALSTRCHRHSSAEGTYADVEDFTSQYGENSSRSNARVEDEEEIERCTSPIKAPKLFKPRPQRRFCEDDSDDFEALNEELGEIEGPGFRSSPDVEGSTRPSTTSEDDFWNF
ncbi:hypothetical protein CHS0354_032431 [Potamilus streckersoni]|uniref:Uncharacterized protein n=1 Tax=Potamilus streckersoni TaxID=2493646 RepID=A0AAE0SQI4_9BIVA|nr:hypothetical protein CHS0354_032431 [Potamilus streckersoni]